MRFRPKYVIPKWSPHEGLCLRTNDFLKVPTLNKMDLVGIVLFLVGLVIKLTVVSDCPWLSADKDTCCPLILPYQMRISQIFYSLSLIVLTVRIMNFYLVTRQLGPKIIMIQERVLSLLNTLFIKVLFDFQLARDCPKSSRFGLKIRRPNKYSSIAIKL